MFFSTRTQTPLFSSQDAQFCRMTEQCRDIGTILGRGVGVWHGLLHLSHILNCVKQHEAKQKNRRLQLAQLLHVTLHIWTIFRTVLSLFYLSILLAFYFTIFAIMPFISLYIATTSLSNVHFACIDRNKMSCVCVVYNSNPALNRHYATKNKCRLQTA